jgi:TolA-binding protein
MKQDKLVTTWLKFADYLSEHTLKLAMAVGGIVLVAGIFFFLNWMKTRGELNASEKLVQARTEYNKQNYVAVIPLLEQLVNEYSGTQSAGIATIYLANAYMHTKDYANAEKFYKKYLDDVDDDPILSISAAYGLAATHEERGDYAKAAALYEQAANEHDESYRAPELLISAARCFKQAGQNEGARRALQKLLDQYPKSALAEEAKLLMAETGQTSS